VADFAQDVAKASRAIAARFAWWSAVVRALDTYGVNARDTLPPELVRAHAVADQTAVAWARILQAIRTGEASLGTSLVLDRNGEVLITRSAAVNAEAAARQLLEEGRRLGAAQCAELAKSNAMAAYVCNESLAKADAAASLAMQSPDATLSRLARGPLRSLVQTASQAPAKPQTTTQPARPVTVVQRTPSRSSQALRALFWFGIGWLLVRRGRA
jgi:hypothetical protein